MDYENLCSKILQISSKIRFVGIFDQWAEKKATTMQPGLKMYIPEHVTLEAVNHAIQIWKIRQKLERWVGTPKYAMAEYDKIKRFTFYLNKNELLLVTTEIDVDDHMVVDNMLLILGEKIKKIQ